jgi:hypothetical protein
MRPAAMTIAAGVAKSLERALRQAPGVMKIREVVLDRE